MRRMAIVDIMDLKVNELAESVLPAKWAATFSALPTRDKLFGLKFFATMVSDQEIIETCSHMEEVLDRYEQVCNIEY